MVLSKQEYALGMGQRSNCVAMRDAKTKPYMEEECASGMAQLSNVAAVKDVQNKPGKEDCALPQYVPKCRLFEHLTLT